MGHYVAFLDILGFKDIILNNSHEDVVRLFDNFRIYVQRSLAKDKTMTDSYGRLTYDVRDSTINSNIISDSLIFWTNNNKATSLFELIDCLHSFTIFCHNLPHIFLRGGITYGDFYYDHNGVIRGQDTLIIHPIMLGRALVDIFEIEKQLEIAGCVVTPAAIDAAKSDDIDLFNEKWKDITAEKKVIEYDMPTKKGILRSWTINWVRDILHPTLDEITKGFSSHKKGTDHPDVKRKIENTINFYNYIKENIYKK